MARATYSDGFRFSFDTVLLDLSLFSLIFFLFSFLLRARSRRRIVLIFGSKVARRSAGYENPALLWIYYIATDLVRSKCIEFSVIFFSFLKRNVSVIFSRFSKRNVETDWKRKDVREIEVYVL